MAVYNEDEEYPTGYDSGVPSGYAPDRGAFGHGVVGADYARPVASFSGTGPKMPRIPTSALEGSSFSSAQMPVDQQFAPAAENSQALRAGGWGPHEYGSSHSILTPEGSSILSTEELLDKIAPRWRADAHDPEMPSFGGRTFGRRSTAPEETAGEAEEAAPDKGNASGKKPF
jgi:hypothetical protein